MDNLKIQQIFQHSWPDYARLHPHMAPVQKKAASAIMACKTGLLGYSTSRCGECGHVEIHHASCRNRNCPNCQAVLKEVWADKRRAEVIDAPYFHVVFTTPHELNGLFYHNQKELYGLLHRCCADTLLELAADKKYLGATPGIIQVLHTWNQELDYHVHMHCIISGGGLTAGQHIRKAGKNFFIPVYVLRDKFKGKFLAHLDKLHASGKLVFSGSAAGLEKNGAWQSFKDKLYKKDWCPYIKETFNGSGNAIEYLGRYTHKIAISNSRIVSVTETETTFWARGIRPGDPKRQVTLDNTEFIRRYLMHVLPSGFQKIRYYGFLNNRMKAVNLKLIFKLQGRQRFKQRYSGMSVAELIKAVWNTDISVCPVCGSPSMKQAGRYYGLDPGRSHASGP